MDPAKTGVDVTPRRLSSSTAVSVGEDRPDPLFAGGPAGWASPSTVLETGSAIPVALSRADTAKQVQIQRVRDSITEMSTLLNEMRQMRQKKSSVNADSVGGETLYQDAVSSVNENSRDVTPSLDEDDASMLRKYQNEIDTHYSDDNVGPLSRPISRSPPQAPVPQSGNGSVRTTISPKPDSALGQPFDSPAVAIKETLSRKNTPVKQAASVEFEKYMSSGQIMSTGTVQEPPSQPTPDSQKALRVRSKRGSVPDRAQAPSKLLSQVDYPVPDEEDNIYDTDATEHKVIQSKAPSEKAPQPPRHRRSFTTNDIIHSRKSTRDTNKPRPWGNPERSHSVKHDGDRRRTPSKEKRHDSGELGDGHQRRPSKKAFEKDTIQALLQQQTYELDDIDLPSAERRLIEKFIEALSKISIEVQMDETKRAEGRRRLNNALRALEGWI